MDKERIETLISYFKTLLLRYFPSVRLAVLLIATAGERWTHLPPEIGPT
jgi:hypothetical protein